MQLLKVSAVLGIVTVMLGGCGGGGDTTTTTTTTTIAKKCEPGTDTDPCKKKKDVGSKPDAKSCTDLGAIGCGGANCTLEGKPGDDKGFCKSNPECKSMTPTDPCFVAKRPGSKPDAKVCKDLGAIGCGGANCELMGDAGSASAHCMSPMSTLPSTAATKTTECEPMTEMDPCFKVKGYGTNPDAQICKDLGAIGCDGSNCTLMGDAGADEARCTSPSPMSIMVNV